MWRAIDAPLNSAGVDGGEADGPGALREAGLLDVFGAETAGGSVPRLTSTERDPDTGVIAYADLLCATEVLRDAVEACMKSAERPLVIGGDCSLLPGAIAGATAAGGRTALWFVDGHADYLDGDTSPTGEAADMELAMLTGRGAASIGRDPAGNPLLQPEEVVILGHRPAELNPDVAFELGLVPAEIARMSADEILDVGARRVAQRWERALAARGRVWLHLDLDVLDEGSLPAVSYPQPRGLDWRALEELVGVFLGSESLVGLSIADFNPELDPGGACSRRVVEALRAAAKH
jgi:arginase